MKANNHAILKDWVLGFRKNAEGGPFILSESIRRLVFPRTDVRFVYDPSLHAGGGGRIFSQALLPLILLPLFLMPLFLMIKVYYKILSRCTLQPLALLLMVSPAISNRT